MRQGMRRAGMALMLVVAFLAPQQNGFAKTAAEIDTKVDTSLEKFQNQVYGAKDIMAKAEGVLVFPRVYKGGIGIGAEYGEGALRVGGKTVDYYNTVSGSIGFQLGGQAKTVYIFFMEDAALANFRQSHGWKVGVDGSIALISVGADGSIDTMKTNEPIVGFILGQKGLMYNLTLEGSKFTKLKR